MNLKNVTTEPVATECAEVIPETLLPAAVPALCGAFTRDVEALCRALDAQQRARFPRTDEEKK